MSKENKEVKVVREVNVVKKTIEQYLLQKKDIPYEELKRLLDNFNIVEEDYTKTLYNFLESNSLAVKMERLFDVIGMLGTISIEDEAILCKTLTVLESYVKTIKS